MRSFERVTVIEGKEWSEDQWNAETIHRAKALELAKNADMCLCFDADERLVGDLPTEPGGYTFGLYDGYLTRKNRKPYENGDLSRLPRMWGVERRDILMFFEPLKAKYCGTGQREPIYTDQVQKSDVLVKHYGKCLSVEHWEETCDFYVKYFPKWREKWRQRKGKAIHKRSDFGTPLKTWSEIENINHR